MQSGEEMRKQSEESEKARDQIDRQIAATKLSVQRAKEIEAAKTASQMKLNRAKMELLRKKQSEELQKSCESVRPPARPARWLTLVPRARSRAGREGPPQAGARLRCPPAQGAPARGAAQGRRGEGCQGEARQGGAWRRVAFAPGGADACWRSGARVVHRRRHAA